MLRIVLCLSLVFSSVALSAKNLVKIGNVVITSEDVENKKNILSKTEPSTTLLSDQYILDTLIMFHLGLIDAVNKKTDQEPMAKAAMDSALFNYYLYKNIDEKVMASKVSETELREFYKKNPELTFKRLIVPAGSDKRDSLKSKLSLYRTDINSGKLKFEDVINRVGKPEQNKFFNGLFKNVSAYSLPKEEYTVLVKLQTGEVSPIIENDRFIEILQLVKKTPYAEADLAKITSSYKGNKIAEGHLKMIEDLKGKYKNIIQYYK